jgi:benzoyl-CoA reductase/2-hydroxyglutaryl-CoA dehydratase subunit BcrC/BadD/HgdB
MTAAMTAATTTADVRRVGFTCAYTPLALIDAAGLVPHRLLPITKAPDLAGAHLHDNLCPHVKRVLDRALADDLPQLAGVVFVNSCDAMRRLADAWATARPGVPYTTMDLPISDDARATDYLAAQLERLRGVLSQWADTTVDDAAIHASAQRYAELATLLQRHAGRPGGRRGHQELLNRSVTAAPAALIEELSALPEPEAAPTSADLPLFIFGNVLPDPAAFDLFEACGARVVGDDLCTGARQIVAARLDPTAPPLPQLARQLLGRPACARTMLSGRPLAAQIRADAEACGARGVVAHVMKFCDPYLARLPAVRAELKRAHLPLLVLEGDCTLRSLGQQRTRIEAFVEMLG